MAKTLNTMHGGENPMLMLLRGIAHQTWLTGLGALSKIQQEGSKLFEDFIQEGEKIEARSLEFDKDKTASRRPTQDMDYLQDLEKIFDDRVCRSLNRLNVPTHEDIEHLHKQIEELHSNIRFLSGKINEKA